MEFASQKKLDLTNALIITPNNRLAKHLAHLHTHPDILPLKKWLRDLWNSSIVLSNSQELMLWQKIVGDGDIPIADKISGLAKIDSSSLEFPLGGDESSLRSVLDIHDSSEQGSQQRGKPKCEEYNDKENITIQLEVKNNKSPASLKDLVVVSSKGAGNILYAANTQNLSRPLANKLQVTSSLLPKVIDQLKKSQVLFYETGGTHAAGIFDKNGEIIAFAEDIGRHNALDKAIGKCLLAYKNTNGLGVVLSSRLSFEMVAKAYRAGLELVVAVSAPTSLAVDAADKWNMTLCGFVRNQQANIYTHSERVILIQ